MGGLPLQERGGCAVVTVSPNPMTCPLGHCRHAFQCRRPKCIATPAPDAYGFLPVNHDDFISRYRLTNFGREQVLLEV